jgi:hypothetical protein
MKLRRTTAFLAASIAVFTTFSCGSSESSTRVKNSALAKTPVLVNGSFSKSGGGWKMAETSLPVSGSCAFGGDGNPSLGTHTASQLVFGSKKASVFQEIMVPEPGRVTFAVLHEIRRPRGFGDIPAKASITVSDSNERYEKTSSGAKKIEATVTTTQNNEKITIVITGIPGRSSNGCKGAAFSDATLIYAKTLPPTTTSTTTTPPATTTTVNPNHPPCGGNVACKVGNTGPGGGLVYFVDEQQPSRYNRYFEIAPPSWNGGTSDPVLTVDEAYNKVSEGVREGSGAVTRSPWNSDADVDWRVPKISELKQIYNSPNKGGITGGEYLSSTRASLQDPTFYFFNFTTGQQRITSLANWQNEKALVRPIRRGPSPCAFGGACKVGDVGPMGGKIFYVTTEDKPIVTNAAPCNGWNPCLYMEVAPQTWNGGTSDPTKLWASPQGCCQMVPNNGAVGTGIGAGSLNTESILQQQQSFDSAARAAWYGNGNIGRWYLPSRDELVELYKNSAKVDGPTANLYWSSTEPNPGQMVAYTVDFSTGDVSGMQYKDGYSQPPKYVRPVRAFAPACPCK